MADPLSIAASIAGLLSCAGQIAKFPGPYVSAAKETPQITARVYSEVQSTQVILSGLQGLTKNLGAVQARHAALVGVDQVVAILTNGVLLFSELEALVRSLSPREGNEQQRLPLRARLQWTWKESTLSTLLARVQDFKNSMSLILMILKSDSHPLALQHQEQLSVSVDSLLESNSSLSRRLMNLENALDVQTIMSRRMSLLSISGTGPQSAETQSPLISTPEQSNSQESVLAMSKFDFEADLDSSRVYRRAQRDTMDFSFRSSTAPSNMWSVFSGLSLSNISIISAIALPLYQEDISSAQHYDFGNGLQVPADPPQPRAKRDYLYECVEIKLKMLQLPGMDEYFEYGPNSKSAFYELWHVLRKGMPLLRLVEALDPQVNIVAFPPDDQASIEAAIFQFLAYFMNHPDLGVDPQFTVSDLMGDDAYGFSMVIDGLSSIMENLTARGIVGPVDAQLMNLAPVHGSAAQEHAGLLLDEFLVQQHMFVRQLEELVELQVWIEANSLLTWNDVIEMFGNARQLASMHIGLLVRMTQNRYLPMSEQEWATVFQYYRDNMFDESHIIVKAQTSRAKIRSCLDQDLDSRLSTSLLRCLRILPFPSQRLSKYIDLINDLSNRDDISEPQKLDLGLARKSVEQAMDIVNDRAKSEEIREALAELRRRVEDWRGLDSANFGKLVLYDSVVVRHSTGLYPLLPGITAATSNGVKMISLPGINSPSSLPPRLR